MSIAPTKLSKSELDLIVVALNHGDTATLKRAFDANRFIDSRLKQPYLNALNDTDEYGDGTQLAEFVADKVIPSFGTKIYKDVQKAFNSKGDQSDAYRVKILHRLDPAKTKPIVVLASEKGAESVQIAAIECLGDHPDTFDLLMKLSKHHGLKWQAERSIAQLGTPASRAFLIDKLERADFSLLFQCRDKKIIELAQKKAEECFNQLKKEQAKAKRKALRERFGSLVRISQNPSPSYDRLLLACLDHMACFETSPREHGSNTIAEIAEIIGLRKKSVAMKLIEARDWIPPDEFGFAADVGRKYLKPSDFFDLFAPYAKPNAKRNTPDGKRDSELFDSLSREFSKLWSFDDFRNGKAEKAKLDPRWAEIAFDLKDDDLILELAHLKHPRLSSYLSSQFTAKATKDPFDVFPIVEAMVRSKHPNAPESYLLMMNKKALGRKFDPDYQRWLYLLKDLPEYVNDEVRKLSNHKKCNKEAAEQIPAWLSLPFDAYFDADAVNTVSNF